MSKKKLLFDAEAREALLRGVNKLVDAVSSTLGPKGNNVIIEKEYGAPIITKDGVTVAREIDLEDKFESLGARIVREAAIKTNDVVGDGPQPLYSRVLTPTGFIRMGDVVKGMELCGTNGSKQIVIDVFEKGEKEVYRVAFTDGRQVECCEDHLWNVTTDYGASHTLTVREMIDSGKIAVTNENDHVKHGFFVQQNEVEFDSNGSDMPIDPYFLGVLLGDGSLAGNGDIELSLGFNKRHILDKIILPEGCTIRVQECEKYIRVKILGKPIRDALRDLDLFGTHSVDKFIPHVYKFASLAARKDLLQGLIDTDGHKNTRNLFEFSTVSSQMAEDFSDVCWSLGIPLHMHLHTRERDVNSYSDKLIYRISQLKGFKYGLAIDSIEPTGERTQMRCLKVSNSDELYVTDGFIVTHNTTTSTVLARGIIEAGMESISKTDVKPIDVRRGLDKACTVAVKALKARAIPLKPEDIKRVASISANDEEIGNVIYEILDEMGKDGIIAVEEGRSAEIEKEIVKGFRIDKGYISPYMVTDPSKMISDLSEVPVFITDMKIMAAPDIGRIMEKVAQAGGRELVLIAEDVTNDALATALENKLRGNFCVLAIKAPGFGDTKVETLKDLAAFCGAKFFSSEENRRFEEIDVSEFGKLHKVTAEREQTTFIDGAGEQAEIDARINEIKTALEQAESKFDKERLEERLARLTGGVAVIKVGAATDVDMREKKMRVEDAVAATKAAAAEGIVAGGGVTFINIAKAVAEALDVETHEGVREGMKILIDVLHEPIKTIAENAGIGGEGVASELDPNDEAYGLDASDGTYKNLVEAGIIDPAKVSRTALENAVSVAGVLLTTQCAITVIPENAQAKIIQ